MEERRERRAGRLSEGEVDEAGRKRKIEELKKEAREYFTNAKGKGARLSEGVEWWLKEGADAEDVESVPDEEDEDVRMSDVEEEWGGKGDEEGEEHEEMEEHEGGEEDKEGEDEEPENIELEVLDWGDDDGDDEGDDEEDSMESVEPEIIEPEVWDWGDDDDVEEEDEEEDEAGSVKRDQTPEKGQPADVNAEAEEDEEPTGWKDYDYEDHRMRDVDEDSP